METLADNLQNVILSIQYNSIFMLKLIGLLWLIQLINAVLKHRLNWLGIYPRSQYGLLGIFFSPFLHENMGHLFFNSIPLFLLGCLVLISGHRSFYIVSIISIVLGGSLTWACGRKAIHIGSSMLVMGYFGYLLAHAYTHFDATSVILALMCLYYFGGLFLALVPGKRETSWESHVFGFISGVLASFACPVVLSMLK